MTLVKPKSDDQVQGEQTKKRTHRLPRPKHGKRWSLLIVALLLILAFAGKFLLSKGPSAAAITYTEEKVAPRTITNSLTGSGTLQPANSYTVTTLIEGEVLSADLRRAIWWNRTACSMRLTARTPPPTSKRRRSR